MYSLTPLTAFEAAARQAVAAADPATLMRTAQALADSATDTLAPFRAEVTRTKARLDQATTPTAYNLALADYYEAKQTLRGAQDSLGIAA